ncbi:flagellar filament capping protein FliD [Pelosinus sp. sgz500959]|uniref:flagellar filament capping protein FliD n=1 Tax=Pelosinus sp. sgz500959 TaxID=3242472 RepID=UPI0036731F69
MSRIYGLSGSGMDVDAIVKSLMTAQRASSAGLTQKKTVLEWKKTAYNSIYTDISNFRNSVFNYKLGATLNPKAVSSSNTSVATATALADAGNISHSLVVSQLADGVKLTSSSTITTGATGTIATQLGVAATAFDITVKNGTATKTITVDPSTMTLNDLVSKINSSGTNVQASYDTTLDRFFLSTTNSGSTAGISLSGNSNANDFIAKLKLGMTMTSSTDSAVPPVTTYTHTSGNGKDAQFTLDGQALTQSSNKFTIASVVYNLTSTTPYTNIQDPNDSTKTILGQQATTIAVTSDIDKTVANIKSLVESYNTILASLNAKLDEARYSSYLPLTDDQKSSMSDDDITAWNVKAKSGMLYHDTTLNSLVTSMRNAFANPVTGITGQYTSTASIGFSTGAYTEKGKLYLDETKLRTAITNDPTVLTKVFATVGTTTTVDGKTKANTQTQGIAARLYDTLQATMDILSTKSGTTATATTDTKSDIAKQMAEYTKRIAAAKVRDDDMESAYYAKFNAMETAFSKLSKQSSWLSQQLG